MGNPRGSQGSITAKIDNGLARDVENNVEISVPVRWFGIQKLKFRLDDDGIMVIGMAVDENFGKERVEGTQFVPYSSFVEHEVLNHWNRY
jgi:hypothetical protein